MHQSEALQLHRTASSFQADVNREYHQAQSADRLKLASSRALGYSALLSLYDMHCCIEGDAIGITDEARGVRIELQNIALREQKSIAAEVVEFAEDIVRISAIEGIVSVSPLICECIYEAAAYYAWHYRESSSKVSLDHLRRLRQTLKSISLRWQVAGKCDCATY